MMDLMYVKPWSGRKGLEYTAPFQTMTKEGEGPKIELLWGDTVQLLEKIKDGSTSVKARARGWEGMIDPAVLGDTPLLEVYFIDVGQGDGVLIVAPEMEQRRHILIDGGNLRSKQQTLRNAADFVDWKFCREYGGTEIRLDAMIASHCDIDHYGGLWDLVNPDPKCRKELNCESVSVSSFYHAGVSHWANAQDKDSLGEIADKRYLTWLLGDRSSAKKATDGSGSRSLYGSWAEFIAGVVSSTKANIQRLSHVTGYLPGYDPAGGPFRIRVLAPYEESYQGKPAIKSYGTRSFDTNGNSIVLRLDYGSARILLNGDLNSLCQRYLMEQYAAEPDAFACDVVKGCHHGSDDVSYAFMQAMNAAATVISSGDSESYGHPRPNIVAASALTGYVQLGNDELITPLVYSTEIERSYKLKAPLEAIGTVKIGGQPQAVVLKKTSNANTDPQLLLEKEKLADGSYKQYSRRMSEAHVVRGVVYGLVNVRTDGETILCGTMNEAKAAWNYKVFSARF